MVWALAVEGRHRRCEDVMKWFLKLGGSTLALTGLAKVISAIGPTRVLDSVDPLLGIPFRQLLLLVGLVELFIAFLCLFTNRQQLSLVAVAWISSNFLAYRVGLWLIGWHRPCKCMGSLTDMLHISPSIADSVMKAVLGCLLLGSYGMLLWQWRLKRRAKTMTEAFAAAC